MDRDDETGGEPVRKPYLCSLAAYTNPADKSLQLTVELPKGNAEQEVSLGAFNYCGRDIAYVPIVVESGVPRVGEIEHLSPCSL